MKSIFVLITAAVLAHFFQSSRADELMGRFNPGRHSDFVMIEREYTDKPEIYLRKEAYGAFKRMASDASNVGIRFKIVSATRSFDHQKAIWQRKWTDAKHKHLSDREKALAILQYSSMPGSSRHHWGTDIDLNALDNAWFARGEGKKLYDWLNSNAHQYGFYQVYTSKDHGRTGYSEEKWHWSYLPLAEKFLSEYNATIKPEDFTGFAGAELAKELRILEDYVNGIEVVQPENTRP